MGLLKKSHHRTWDCRAILGIARNGVKTHSCVIARSAATKQSQVFQQPHSHLFISGPLTGMIDQTPENQKQLCVRCKERKDPDKFCSPKFSIMYCIKFNIPMPSPTGHTPLQPVALCAACLRTLAKKENQKRHNRKPKNRLCQNIKTGIRKSLRTGKPGLWESYVGYTLGEFREHLQSQFEPGMSWGNYGRWHIDHIRPIASFDFDRYDDEDFKRCWSLSNLRPLWARDNWTRKKKTIQLCRMGNYGQAPIMNPLNRWLSLSNPERIASVDNE